MRANAQNKFPITAGQIKKIHALKNALGMDDELYRQTLHNYYQAKSSKELNQQQAGELIEVMEATAVQGGVWTRREEKLTRTASLGERPGMASPGQLKKIQAQWNDVSRVEQPEERAKALRHFIERIAKVSDLRFLDATGAGKVLNALKAMQAQKSAAKPKRTKTAK